MIVSWQENDEKPGQCIEKQRHDSADQGLYCQGYGLPSDHIWLWKMDCKEGRRPKELMPSNCGAGEDSWKVPWISKEIKPANLKGNQPWILVGRTDAEAEASIFWSFDVNSQLIEKPLMLENIEGRRRKSYGMG